MNPIRFMLFLMAMGSPTQGFPHNSIEGIPKREHPDVEFSGNGADEPVRGSVRVVHVSPHFFRKTPGLFGNRVHSRDAPKRSPFPAFLALARAGPPVPAVRAPALPHSTRVHDGAEARKKQGVEMWQRVMEKKEKEGIALPVNPKEMGVQSCAAVPFVQRVTEEGCEEVSVHNKLCFGQCSSMFVPNARRSAPCTSCAPSRSRTVRVPLRCGALTREKRVLLVEECKCQTGGEEGQTTSM